jgi:hypothetical protein
MSHSGAALPRNSDAPVRRAAGAAKVAVTCGWITALLILSAFVQVASADAAHRPASPRPLSTATSAPPVLSPLAQLLGSLPGTHALPSVASPGYWLASSAGLVGAYGGSPFMGSLNRTNLDAPVVGMAATPDGRGYWLAASDGGVFAFGDANFDGSAAGTPLNQHVVGIAASPAGHGYWLVASDGGVFAFGDAGFFGSAAGTPLNHQVVGMDATPDGRGYWLVAGDGGVFAFGDAGFYGSAAGTPLNDQVVGMAATPDGRGYWLVGSDGGVFSFGDAGFYGSAAGTALHEPVVGIGSTPDGHGYWLAAADGGVFSFGDAPFRGAASNDVPFGDAISALATGPGVLNGEASGDFLTPASIPIPPLAAPYPQGAIGFDISYPQCHKAYPSRTGVAVVGVNHGSAFTTNPCFPSEARWAGPNLSVYLNLNSPPASDPADWDSGPDGICGADDMDCASYNYGFNAAQRSMGYVRSVGFSPHSYMLDVETTNTWSPDTTANADVIAGAIDAIHQAGDAADVYSTDYQWGQIAGSYVPGVPAWYATGISTFFPQTWCSGASFAGGPIDLVQGNAGSFDGDYAC